MTAEQWAAYRALLLRPNMAWPLAALEAGECLPHDGDVAASGPARRGGRVRGL
jgi:hypothetical protein